MAQYSITFNLKDVPEGVDAQSIAGILGDITRKTIGQSIHLVINENDAPEQWDRVAIAQEVKRGRVLPGDDSLSLDLPGGYIARVKGF